MKRKLNLEIIKYNNYGLITVSINSKLYQYQIEGYQIKRVLELSKYHKGKALNYLKQCDKIGRK